LFIHVVGRARINSKKDRSMHAPSKHVGIHPKQEHEESTARKIETPGEPQLARPEKDYFR
jgi:hypothetical protein